MILTVPLGTAYTDHLTRPVQRRHADPLPPRRLLPCKPVCVHLAAAALDHIQHPGATAGGEVDDAGGEPGATPWAGVLPHVLVHPKAAHPLQPVLGIQQWLAVGLDRAHHGVPPHAEPVGDRLDGVAVAADLLTRPPAGPFGQRRPRRDLRVPLRPRPLRARRFGAPPQPLAPHQQRRPPRRGDVTHQMLTPAVGHRDHPAPRAPGHRLGGLHQQLQLTAVLTGGKHHQPRDAEHRSGQDGSLNTHLGLLSIRCLVATNRGVPGPSSPAQPGQRVATRLPRLVRKSR
ncbi:Uncharacterised protein [Dermacoccus nishinomiyaensis]|nr:Uncharacterised protein [Dermacoccus nishinomiyaensis]